MTYLIMLNYLVRNQNFFANANDRVTKSIQNTGIKKYFTAMSRIILILKDQLELLPPVLSCAQVLSSFGLQLELIVTSCNKSTVDEFREKGITIHCLYSQHYKKTSRLWVKAIRWLEFRRLAWKTYGRIATKDDLLWVGSADTALALGKRLLSHKYVLHIHELYDTLPRYRDGLKAYAKSAAAIVVPDMSRAAIFRVWWGLSKTPFVVPNKPFTHPRRQKIEISDVNIKKQIDEIGNVPIVLYQGHIVGGRSLDVVAKAIHNHSLPIRLVLMGKDHGRFVEHLKTLCPNLVPLGFITPPHHLEVTSHAAIGIIQYNFSCLNHVFCAPNKIWEYSGFGVPTLAADLPSLRYYLDRYKAGVCCDFDSEDDVAKAIKQIVHERESYLAGATALYESYDLSESYQSIFKELELCVKQA